jgi:molecular chaperone DnaK
VDIRYEFPSRTADDRIRIRARAGNDVAQRGYRIIADAEDGWTSGQVLLEALTDIKDISLSKRGENKIRITVLDSGGASISEAATELSVFRTLATTDGMPTTHTISVKVVEGTGSSERNTLYPLVKKGTPLPSSGMETFRAARDLRANDGTYLDFELFEQMEGVDDPALNLGIGAFRISSTDLERGDVIRKGDNVFVSWLIDGNGLLSCELEVPEISQTFSTHRVYVSTRDHKNFDGEEGVSLAAEAINAADDDIGRLEKALGSRIERQVDDLRGRIARQREALRLAHEADTRRAVSEEGRLIRQEVARIRNEPQNNRAALRAEIDEFVEGFSLYLSKTADPRVNAQVHRLAGLARDALMKETQNSIEDARRSLDEMRAIVFSDFAKTASILGRHV